MKRLLIVLPLLFSFLFLSETAFAQKNKKDKQLKKEWKRKAKTYVKNPLALKSREESFQRQMDECSKKLAELTQKYTELQSELDKVQDELRRKNDENNSLKEQVKQLNVALEAAKQTQTIEKEIKTVSGLEFRVQVGAFKFFNLQQYLREAGEDFKGESSGELNKYTIGRFRDYNMANSFKKDIRRMGLKDAWIVPYYDGVRISIDEASKKAGTKFNP